MTLFNEHDAQYMVKIMLKCFDHSVITALILLSVALPITTPLEAQQYPVQFINSNNINAPAPVLFPIDSPYTQVSLTWGSMTVATSFTITDDEEVAVPIQPGDIVNLNLRIENLVGGESTFEVRLLRNNILIGNAPIPGVNTSWCQFSSCTSNANFLVLQPVVTIPEPNTMLILGSATLLTLLGKRLKTIGRSY